MMPSDLPLAAAASAAAVPVLALVASASHPATPRPAACDAAADADTDDPSWLHRWLHSLLALASFGPPYYYLRHSSARAAQARRARHKARAALAWQAAMRAHPGQSVLAGVKRAGMMQRIMNGESGDEQPAEAMEMQHSLGWMPNAEANDAFAAASAAASAASAAIAASSSPAIAAPAAPVPSVAADDLASASAGAASCDASGHDLAAVAGLGESDGQQGVHTDLAAASASASSAAASSPSLNPPPPVLQSQDLEHGYTSADNSLMPHLASQYQHRLPQQHQHLHRNHAHRSSSPTPAPARARRRIRSRYCSECHTRGEDLGHPDPHSRHFAPSLHLPSTGTDALKWAGRWVVAPVLLMGCQILGSMCAERAWEALATRAGGKIHLRPSAAVTAEILHTSKPMTPAEAARIVRNL